MRVGLASICRKLLEEFGIEVGSRVIQIHKIKDTSSMISMVLRNSTISSISDLPYSVNFRLTSLVSLTNSWHGDKFRMS